jgi:hypothetical protein
LENITRSFKDHESPSAHFKSVLTHQKRLSIIGQIDTHLEEQIDSKRKYWRAILQQIFATVKYLQI